MDETARLALPMLSAGQNAKELFHNEALLTADALLCPVVEGLPAAAAPGSPVFGQCFAIGSGASGAWAGKDGQLANWTEGGWRFVAVPEGAAFRVRASGVPLVRTATGWEAGVVRGDELRIGGVAVVKGQQAAIAAPTGGTTNDAQARTAIGQILTALRAHGLIAT